MLLQMRVMHACINTSMLVVHVHTGSYTGSIKYNMLVYVILIVDSLIKMVCYFAVHKIANDACVVYAQNADWEANPAECIIGHTYHNKVSLLHSCMHATLPLYCMNCQELLVVTVGVHLC